jgi:hypothetical protein
VWGRNAQYLNPLAEPVGGVRAELSQQKCVLSAPEAGQSYSENRGVNDTR